MTHSKEHTAGIELLRAALAVIINAGGKFAGLEYWTLDGIGFTGSIQFTSGLRWRKQRLTVLLEGKIDHNGRLTDAGRKMWREINAEQRAKVEAWEDAGRPVDSASLKRRMGGITWEHRGNYAALVGDRPCSFLAPPDARTFGPKPLDKWIALIREADLAEAIAKELTACDDWIERNDQEQRGEREPEPLPEGQERIGRCAILNQNTGMVQLTAQVVNRAIMPSSRWREPSPKARPYSFTGRVSGARKAARRAVGMEDTRTLRLDGLGHLRSGDTSAQADSLDIHALVSAATEHVRRGEASEAVTAPFLSASWVD